MGRENGCGAIGARAHDAEGSGEEAMSDLRLAAVTILSVYVAFAVLLAMALFLD